MCIIVAEKHHLYKNYSKIQFHHFWLMNSYNASKMNQWRYQRIQLICATQDLQQNGQSKRKSNKDYTK